MTQRFPGPLAATSQSHSLTPGPESSRKLWDALRGAQHSWASLLWCDAGKGTAVMGCRQSIPHHTPCCCGCFPGLQSVPSAATFRDHPLGHPAPIFLSRMLRVTPGSAGGFCSTSLLQGAFLHPWSFPHWCCAGQDKAGLATGETEAGKASSSAPAWLPWGQHTGTCLLGPTQQSHQQRPEGASSAHGSLHPPKKRREEGDVHLLCHAYFIASGSGYFRRRRVCSFSQANQENLGEAGDGVVEGRRPCREGVGPGSGRLSSSFSWLQFSQPKFGLK